MPMHARDLYPILYSFKTEGDTATVKSLQLWTREFHLEPPQTAANDNDPNVGAYEWETHIDAEPAENLIRSMAEDDNCERNPDFERSTPAYSADLHEERFERVKNAKKSAPPLLDYVDAEAETNRYIDARKMRDWLGCDADVLDMAVEPHVTFADVGSHIGVDADEAKQEIKGIAAEFYERAA